MKTIGIVAHSAEGGALCFLTACRTGGELHGAHMHPTIVLSAIPMGLSMPAWEAGDYEGVGRYLRQGVEQVAAAGADFYVCPDNTAHIVLEKIAGGLPIPGLHIADVVMQEIESKGWKRVGLLGTNWTMCGPVYAERFKARRFEALIPDEATRGKIHAAIFDELCRGVFREATTRVFVDAINSLRGRGAESVILGCTEIPLIINEENSPLPILDSTRLLAQYAVQVASSNDPMARRGYWLTPKSGIGG